MAVLVVNWDDTNQANYSYNLLANGVATSAADNCVVTDVWAGTSQTLKGDEVY
jgi:hypothetical protein